MSPLPALIALSALLLGCWGLRDLVGLGRDDGPRKVGSPAGSATRRSLAAGKDTLGLAKRIRRAGLEGAMSARFVLTAKAAGAAAGLTFGSLFAAILPGRLAPLVVVGSAAGMFLLPDLVLERAARRRHRGMITALPDVLDLLTVSVTAGRGFGASLADLAGTGRGPLVAELARTGDEISWGASQAVAMEGLRTRIGGPEITSVCATLERSRRLGSPLADQLRRQSATLRQQQRRRIEEEAARAAPKIQLVIALVLVPSVLLLIVAGLVANADSLLNPVVGTSTVV